MQRFTLYLLMLASFLPTLGQERPDVLFQQRFKFIVMAAEKLPTATVLEVRVNQKPDLWFMFGRDIMLRDPQGRTYPIRGVDSPYGNQLGKKMFARHEGEIRVRLIFPAIPVHTTDVDLTGEVPTENGIYGIRLDGRQWQDVLGYEPTDEPQVDSPNDTLPMPTLRYGTAIVRGRLQNFRKGMLNHVVLYQNPVRYMFNATARDTLWAPVSDEGNFEFRLPVTHEQPVAIGYEGRQAMMCYAAPDDTTVVSLDMALINRPKQQRRHYYSMVQSGPLARLANEYNWTQTPINFKTLRSNLLGRYWNHPDLVGSNPKELFSRYLSIRGWNRPKRSPALHELMDLDEQLSMIAVYQMELTGYPAYITERGVMAKTLFNKRRKRWAADIGADKMEAYISMFTSPKQLLCPHFMGIAHYLSGLPTMYPDYVDHEVNTYSLKQQLSRDFTQLDSVQLQQNMATLPSVYRQWLDGYRQHLSCLIEANSSHTTSRICQLPKTQYDQEIFGQLCQRYRGRLMFLDFWFPTLNSGMADVRDIMQPLQQEFADYDIAWVHIARHNNENSWRQQLTLLPGDHYSVGSESYPGTAIVYSAMERFRMESHYLYVIVDENGRVVYRRNRPTDLQDLREELQKYVKKKTE